jgi:hypothetical protein
MRLLLGINRPTSPRSILKAEVNRVVARLAGTAVNAALDPESDPLKAGALALRLIETADPPSQATLEISADLTPEQIEGMSWSEALAAAKQLGIDTVCHGVIARATSFPFFPPSPDPAPPRVLWSAPVSVDTV